MDILKQEDAYRTTEWRNNDIFTADFIVFLHSGGVLYQMNEFSDLRKGKNRFLQDKH